MSVTHHLFAMVTARSARLNGPLLAFFFLLTFVFYVVIHSYAIFFLSVDSGIFLQGAIFSPSHFAFELYICMLHNECIDQERCTAN